MALIGLTWGAILLTHPSMFEHFDLYEQIEQAVSDEQTLGKVAMFMTGWSLFWVMLPEQPIILLARAMCSATSMAFWGSFWYGLYGTGQLINTGYAIYLDFALIQMFLLGYHVVHVLYLYHRSYLTLSTLEGDTLPQILYDGPPAAVKAPAG